MSQRDIADQIAAQRQTAAQSVAGPDAEETLGQRAQCAVDDPRERAAMQLLADAGWSDGELAMTFQCSKRAVRRIKNTEQTEESE